MHRQIYIIYNTIKQRASGGQSKRLEWSNNVVNIQISLLLLILKAVFRNKNETFPKYSLHFNEEDDCIT